jgi:hypothetical protein
MGVLRNQVWLYKLFGEYESAGIKAIRAFILSVAPSVGAHPNCAAGRTAAQLFGGVTGRHAWAHRAPTRGALQVQLPAIHPPWVDHTREESWHGERCDQGKQSVEKVGAGRAPRGGPVHVGHVHGCTGGVGFEFAVLRVPLSALSGVDGPWEWLDFNQEGRSSQCFGKDWNRRGVSLAGPHPIRSMPTWRQRFGRPRP